MNKPRIVLAYSGTSAGSASIAWLREHHGADVVTLTVDVGQSGDLEEARARALACGALRAHVVDVRDAFARDGVVPALRNGVTDGAALRRLPDPLVARTLAEIAAIESADAVAHAADGVTAAAFDEALARAGATWRVLAPARQWGRSRLLEYATTHGLPRSGSRSEPHLLIRPTVDPSRAPHGQAHLELAFVDGVPLSLNGVSMTLEELIESLSLIAGQYGLGHGESWPMPAAHVLHAAYRQAGGVGAARIALSAGAWVPMHPAPVGAGVFEK